MKKIAILFLFLTLGVGFFTINSIRLSAEGAAKLFEVGDVLPATTQLRISWQTIQMVRDMDIPYVKSNSDNTSVLLGHFFHGGIPAPDGEGYLMLYGVSVTSHEYEYISAGSTIIDTTAKSLNDRTISYVNPSYATLFTWEDLNSGYTISFNSNGGTTISDIEDATELPTPLPTTTKSGYTFLGWYYDSLFTQEATAGDELEDNVTLYAKWELTTYTITYNTNGGSSVSQTTNATQLPDPLPITTKTGFTFLGWFYDSAFQIQAIAGDTIESNVTLYAKWDLSGTKWFINSPHLLALTHPEEDASEYWAIVFKSKGITFNQLYIEYFESGTTYLEYHTNVGTKIVVCVLDGDDIVYFDDTYANIEIISVETSSSRLIEILELIATLQTSIQNYTLSFVSNGGTPIPDRYIDDRLTQLPIPERANSRFTGWYYDSELSQRANNGDLISDDTVLYAGWILNSIYEDLTDARFSEGYSTGFYEGYSTGFDEGYDTGFGEGEGSAWEEAYEEGFRDALELADADIKDAWDEGYNFAKESFGFQKDGKYYDGKSAYMLGYNDNDNLRKLFIPALVIIFIASIVLSGINVFRKRD